MQSGLFRRLKDEFDWDSYVRQTHDVKDTTSRELRICCFACGDTNFKLYVNPEKKQWICFKCSYSSKTHDLFDFVSRSENISRFAAIKRIAREYSFTTPLDEQMGENLNVATVVTHTPTPSVRYLESMPKDLIPLKTRTEASAKFWDYLISRGLTPSEICAINVYYSPLENHIVYDSKGNRKGDIADRVIWPIYGGDHRLVSWQGRMILPAGPKDMKFLTAPESDLSKTLWPYVKPQTKRAFLCEGVLDALSYRRVQGVDVYATFTKKISETQIQVLKSWGITDIVVMWDKKDSRREIKSAIPELKMQFSNVYVSNMAGIPATTDAGALLLDPEGPTKLKAATEDLVNTYDDLAYARWELTF
jgi:DNA primase